jgi:hypothetical protein
MANYPTRQDYEAFDKKMLDFYIQRVREGADDPEGDTLVEFGEDASWCENAAKLRR